MPRKIVFINIADKNPFSCTQFQSVSPSVTTCVAEKCKKTKTKKHKTSRKNRPDYVSELVQVTEENVSQRNTEK